MKKKSMFGDIPLPFMGKKSLLIMKQIFILMLVFNLNAFSAINAQQISEFRVQNATLKSCIKKVESLTGLGFLYNGQELERIGGISLDLKNVDATVVLESVLKGTGYTYKLTNGVIAIMKAAPAAPAPKRPIKGVVKDKDGMTLPGVSVLIKGTQSGVATDINGSFEINVDDDPNLVLSFSFVGMQTKEVKIGANKVLNVVLELTAQALDEVVITGYQTLSKERATGSFSVLTNKDFENKLQTNVMDRLEGLVAGVVSYNNKIQIRGTSTLYGNKNPLYVVDGMPYEGSIDAINPSDVTNVTVLKDATAASIYGARAANGVIVITTKKGGGKAGADRKLSVSYNGSVRFQPLPDLDYLELVNSSDFVDLQVEGFKYYHTPTPNKRSALNEVTDLLYQNERGELSGADLESQLNAYRRLDNKKQIKDEFLRTALKHQHNLSVSGGNDKNAYLFSINYTGNNPYEKTMSEERVGFNFKDDLQLTPWLKADLGIIGSFTTAGGDNGLSASLKNVSGSYLGAGGMGQSGALSMYTSGASYLMLRDANNNPRAFRKSKSDYELNRLTSLGLLDETYIPLDELNRAELTNKSSYYRAQVGFNIKLMEGLTVDLQYQNENTSIKNRQLFDKDSYMVRNMVNDATVIDPETGEVTQHIPAGGQLQESRADIYSYTMRAQVNFNRIFKEKHAVTALIGGERRLVRTTATNTHLFGYDDNSLGYKPANPLVLGPIQGTEAVNGSYNYGSQNYNNLTHDEDRYVSFYGNASYTYNDRYAITGSIRIDQSNLFGTDPKYQYKPLWSVGASWYMAEEEFMQSLDWLDRLNVRLTYGINGNVSKASGPYLTVYDEGYLSWTDDFAASISNPPNPELRWEKTAVTNVGIDFSLFNSRLGGSIEYYNKKSTDLLGYRTTDPTIGWGRLMMNYGSMSNKGVEVALTSVNIRQKDFEWSSGLNISYNKNEIIDIQNTDNRVWSYIAGTVSTVGKPVGSLFSYRSAGLNPENGSFMVYDENGDKKTNVQSLDALTYSGTTIPPYSVSLSNRFNYKGLSLSFMFLYNGGHVMRDDVIFLTGAPGSNSSKRALKHWQKPGDEKISGMMPAMNRSANYITQQVWFSADENVVKADYIKLRELSLGYTVPSAWTKKWHVENLAVNLQVNDLWWWAANDGGIDPEAYTTVGYSQGKRALPRPTTYTLGLSVNF